MDVRIFPITKREHPPTITANEARSTKKVAAHLEETRRAKYEETRSGNVGYRIPGIPHSTVQKEDSNRKEMVKKTDSTVRDAGLVNRGFEED